MLKRVETKGAFEALSQLWKEKKSSPTVLLGSNGSWTSPVMMPTKNALGSALVDNIDQLVMKAHEAAYPNSRLRGFASSLILGRLIMK